MKPSNKIQKLVDEARDLALNYVEEQARKILRQHPNLTEFVMAMGSCTFSTVINGREDNLGLEDRAYFKPLQDFIWEWNDILGILGEPMRFTADGPVIREW